VCASAATPSLQWAGVTCDNHQLSSGAWWLRWSEMHVAPTSSPQSDNTTTAQHRLICATDGGEACQGLKACCRTCWALKMTQCWHAFHAAVVVNTSSTVPPWDPCGTVQRCDNAAQTAAKHQRLPEHEECRVGMCAPQRMPLCTRDICMPRYVAQLGTRHSNRSMDRQQAAQL
jgi:hypothetical protein